MATKKKNLVIANWKMNPESSAEAKAIFLAIKKQAAKLKKTEVVVCPSFPHLPLLSKYLPAKNLYLGAQNSHQKNYGAYTGEVAATQLKEFKVKYVILGHSERRSHPAPTAPSGPAGEGEGDNLINAKIKNALANGITPVLCVGEKERDSDGRYLQFIKDQLARCLADVSKSELLGIIIAYEPIWAIGKTFESSLSPTDMHEMSLFIRKFLSDHFGRDYGWNVRILYGGSIESQNATAMMERGEIAGLLVGHTSLVAKEFGEILKEVDGVK